MQRDIIFLNGNHADQDLDSLRELGFKFGDKGAHTSRTMMLQELSSLLQHCPPSATRSDYATAITGENSSWRRGADGHADCDPGHVSQAVHDR
jgi:hypothetical protein